MAHKRPILVIIRFVEQRWPWIAIASIIVAFLAILINYASYKLDIRGARSSLTVRDPGEQAIEVGESEIYPLSPSNITLVSEHSVTCGHVLRLVNNGGSASNVGEIHANIEYGIDRNLLSFSTSEGAVMYDRSSANLPPQLTRAALYLLPDAPWPIESNPNFWAVATDMPFSVEANAALDIKIGLTFFFADGYPRGLNDSDFNLYDPIEWSLGTIFNLVPFSVSYELSLEDGALAKSQTFTCFDGTYVKGRR